MPGKDLLDSEKVAYWYLRLNGFLYSKTYSCMGIEAARQSPKSICSV